MRRRKNVKSFMTDVVSFDGPPLDFTNKKVKDLKGIYCQKHYFPKIPVKMRLEKN